MPRETSHCRSHNSSVEFDEVLCRWRTSAHDAEIKFRHAFGEFVETIPCFIGAVVDADEVNGTNDANAQQHPMSVSDPSKNAADFLRVLLFAHPHF